MTYLRAFIAGVALPALLLPIMLCIAVHLGKTDLLTISELHWIPVIWGIWNILYYGFFRGVVDWHSNAKLFTWGAILGFLIAIYGVFILHIPTLLGIDAAYHYFPLLIAPVVYGILWMFIVKVLNRAVGLND